MADAVENEGAGAACMIAWEGCVLVTRNYEGLRYICCLNSFK